MMNNEQPPFDPMKRIAELEAELAHVKRDRDRVLEIFCPKVPIPPELYEPMTEEEIVQMMNEPHCGKSISELVAEFETQMDRGS